jgi:cytidine deaminase
MTNDMLDPTQAQLLEEARLARTRAYAPYSHFAVGAAVLTADGQIFHGCNIENASYGVTNCAERSALFSAYSAGVRAIVALAVVADTSGPVSPCGICRQAIFELAPNATILLGNMGSDLMVTSPQRLLPYGFEPSELPDA